jgi:hypothetical protein
LRKYDIERLEHRGALYFDLLAGTDRGQMGGKAETGHGKTFG